MTPPTLTSRRALLAVMLAGTMTLGVSACGRRGRPEPPSDATTQQQRAQADKTKAGKAGKAQPTFGTRPTPSDSDDNDEDEDQRAKEDPAGANIMPMAPTSRKKSRAYDVPKQPFLLDFLL